LIKILKQVSFASKNGVVIDKTKVL